MNEARGSVPWVKCLLCKPADRTADPQYPGMPILSKCDSLPIIPALQREERGNQGQLS